MNTYSKLLTFLTLTLMSWLAADRSEAVQFGFAYTNPYAGYYAAPYRGWGYGPYRYGYGGFGYRGYAGYVGGAPFVNGYATGPSFPTYNRLPTRLDGYRGMLQDVHPASWAQTRYLYNRWFFQVSKDIEHYGHEIRRNTYDTYQAIASLEQAKQDVLAVTAGGASSFPSMRRFYVMAMRHGYDGAGYDAMNRPVSELRFEDFVADSKMYAALTPRGDLRPMPIALAKLNAGRATDQAVRQSWTDITSDLAAYGYARPEAVEAFADSVHSHRKLADAYVSLVKKDPQRWQREAKGLHAVRAHARSLDVLAGRMYQPTAGEEVCMLLEGEGLRFSGGTVQDLVRHLFENRLVPRQGSRAQYELHSLGNCVVNVLDQKLAEKRNTLEVLKGQHLNSPNHPKPAELAAPTKPTDGSSTPSPSDAAVIAAATANFAARPF